MKREIKFRAWMRGNMYYNHSITLTVDGTVAYLDTDGNWEEDYKGDVVELMQYTGLDDKNGVEIFEGDVVYCDHWSPSKYQIRFIEGAFCLCNAKCEWMADVTHLEDSKGKHFEIIGNIYQNPELL